MVRLIIDVLGNQPSRGWRNLNVVPLFLCIAILAATLLTGCHKSANSSDAAASEKLGYIFRSGKSGSLVITNTNGDQGQSLLDWRGYAERFVFSNDGRFFTLVMTSQEPGKSMSEKDDLFSEYLLASTDGSRALHIPDATMLTFSPDSSRIAYLTVPNQNSDGNQLGIIDIATGTRKNLVQGGMLVNPVWVNDSTVVYTALHKPVFSPRSEGGVIYRLDVDSGETTQLTPSDRSFSIYNAPLSFNRSRITLTEMGPLYNIWSLDVNSGELWQLSNNTFFNFRTGYLPGTNKVVFEIQKTPDDSASSEVAVMTDDGSDFTLLTSNFFFDGLHSQSLESGKIAYQSTSDSEESSIWTINADGSEAALIAESSKGWVGDPNFTPVPYWKADNPLKMSVSSNPGKPLVVNISNTSGNDVEAVLRAFPGLDLELTAADGSQPEVIANEAESPETEAELSNPQLEWDLRLEANETIEIGVLANPRPTTVATPALTSLLFTLEVPDTPPRMYWQHLE